jgi:uncharacterized protein YbbC (DUF1343 family)
MKCAKLTAKARRAKIAALLLALPVAAAAQQPVAVAIGRPEVTVGAARTEAYLPLLRGRRVAVVTNQTGMIGGTHLVDSLLTLGVQVVKVFAPEHGFRGEADAGEHVKDQRDARTGLPLVSLYGANKKPPPRSSPIRRCCSSTSRMRACGSTPTSARCTT